MYPPVFLTLIDNPAVESIVAQRVYRHDYAPQKVAKPYITWTTAGFAPANQLSGTPLIDQVTVQVDCWHQTDAGVHDLAVAVRDAVEPYAHMTGIPLDLREPDTKLYRVSLQFDWWWDRSAQVAEAQAFLLFSGDEAEGVLLLSGDANVTGTDRLELN